MYGPGSLLVLHVGDLVFCKGPDSSVHILYPDRYNFRVIDGSVIILSPVYRTAVLAIAGLYGACVPAVFYAVYSSGADRVADSIMKCNPKVKVLDGFI